MAKLLISLQFRLMMTFVVVLALALGSVSVYARWATEREIERFEQEYLAVREERLERIIHPYLGPAQDMDALRNVLEQAGALYGLRIAVADGDGLIVSQTRVAPDYAFFGDAFVDRDGLFKLDRRDRPFRRQQDRSNLVPIGDGGEQVGTIAFTTAGPNAFVRPEPPVTAMLDNVNGFLLWAGLAAGGAGIVFTVLLSRRTLAPLQTLRSAAERLGTGDLSQRVAVSRNDEIGEMARTFNAMAADLERSEEQRRDLMADVAHELRTPLANIQGYVEALRDSLVQADAATIDTLHQQVLHLTHLIEDLRLLALAEAGALRLDPQPGSLADAVRTPVEAIRPRAGAKGITLTLEAADGMPEVPMDRERIAQVVANLLENAVQHTPEGGSVTVTVERVGSAARVSVRDTGAGILADDVERMFDRFHRLDPSRTRATGGAGLGLTIAKQFVEAHGGTIRAESALGAGSTFIFELPLE